MRRVILASVAIALALSVFPARAQVKMTKDQILFHTSEWKGERFADGRSCLTICSSERRTYRSRIFSDTCRVKATIAKARMAGVDAHPERLKMPHAEFDKLLKEAEQKKRNQPSGYG